MLFKGTKEIFDSFLPPSTVYLRSKSVDIAFGFPSNVPPCLLEGLRSFFVPIQAANKATLFRFNENIDLNFVKTFIYLFIKRMNKQFDNTMFFFSYFFWTLLNLLCTFLQSGRHEQRLS